MKNPSLFIMAGVLSYWSISAQTVQHPRVIPVREAVQQKHFQPTHYKEAGEAFFTEDFANGLAGNNEAGVSWTTDSDDGTSAWEYRGPSTTPDQTVGSRGACATGGGPIASETADNGFVLYDSNWWDDPGADCGGARGSGPAPSPQVARLTSGSIDLSGQPAVQLFFHFYGAYFSATTDLKINISIGGGPFVQVGTQDVFDILSLAQATFSAPDQLVGIDISEMAGGQSDVRIQFEWSGDYYVAMIDDIRLDTPPDVDLSISAIRLDDDINNPIYRYRELPLSQAHLHTPNATITSKGLLTGDVQLKVNVYYREAIGGPLDNLIASDSVTITDVARDSTFTLFVPDITRADSIGNYMFEYIVTHSEGEDALPADNLGYRSFDVQTQYWADENGRTYGGNFYQAFRTNGDPSQPFAEVTAGQVFYTFTDYPTQVNGLHTLVPDFGTVTNRMTEGQLMYIAFYRVIDRDVFLSGPFDENNLFFLGEREIFLEPRHLATDAASTSDFMFESPFILEPDEYYIATFRNTSNEPFNIPVTTGNNDDFSGLLKGMIQAGADNVNFIRYSNVNPYIKLVIDSENEPTVVREQLADHHSRILLQNAPNPADQYTRIRYRTPRATAVQIEVLDITGKAIDHVDLGQQAAGKHEYRLNTDHLPDGIYYYRLTAGGEQSTQKLIVSH